MVPTALRLHSKEFRSMVMTMLVVVVVVREEGRTVVMEVANDRKGKRDHYSRSGHCDHD